MIDSVQKEDLLYEGKGKKVFKTSDPSLVIFEYKNDLTAFNAQKRGTFEGKGEINCAVSEFFFRELERAGIQTHWVSRISKTEAIVRKAPMFALEVIVRNKVAGSLQKRLGVPRGQVLKRPIIEFCYKRDDLGDPIVTEDHIAELELASAPELGSLKMCALRVNDLLRSLLAQNGMDLADFKMEMGKGPVGEILVADEFSPDSMRLWNEAGESFDKDRFRFDTGDVGEGYREVVTRLKGSEQWKTNVTEF